VESTAERILSEGIRCFAERGYKAATTRFLAEAAGVNVATLAYHFGDKEGLYRAALLRVREELLGYQPDLTLLAGGTPAERIERLARHVYAYLRQRPLALRLLLRAEGDPAGAAARDHLLARAEAAWELLGLPPRSSRGLELLALCELFARFAARDPLELRPYSEAAAPQAAAEEVLVQLSLSLLQPGDPKGS